MSKGLHKYCYECGSLITNAIGECYNCIDDSQGYQEQWECDEMADYDHEEMDYDEWVGEYDE